MNRPLSILLLLAFVSGCTGTREVIVEKTTLQYATLDDQWLSPVPVIKAPAFDEAYIKATLQERIDLWTKFYIRYAESSKSKNLDLDTARKYNALKRQERTVFVCREGDCVQK